MMEEIFIPSLQADWFPFDEGRERERDPCAGGHSKPVERKSLRYSYRIRRLLPRRSFKPSLTIPVDDDEKYTSVTTSIMDNSMKSIDSRGHTNDDANTSTANTCTERNCCCCEQAVAHLLATLKWLVAVLSGRNCDDDDEVAACRCAEDLDSRNKECAPEMGVEVFNPYSGITSWDGDLDKLKDKIECIINALACGEYACGPTRESENAKSPEAEQSIDAFEVVLQSCEGNELATTEMGGVPLDGEDGEGDFISRLLSYFEQVLFEKISCQSQVRDIVVDDRQSQLLLSLILRNMEEVIFPVSSSETATSFSPPIRKSWRLFN